MLCLLQEKLMTEQEVLAMPLLQPVPIRGARAYQNGRKFGQLPDTEDMQKHLISYNFIYMFSHVINIY